LRRKVLTLSKSFKVSSGRHMSRRSFPCVFRLLRRLRAASAVLAVLVVLAVLAVLKREGGSKVAEAH
jgi:hypothetical protein